jgi:hypothetical protein
VEAKAKETESSKTSDEKPQVSTAKSSEVAPSASSSSRGQTKEGGATDTVEKDVVNAFKQFSAVEKMKAQEHQRSLARRDKAVKLNDLKKFAENFKLNTVVPPDLVPILAKDKKKQQEIVDKAKKQAVDGPTKTTPPRPTVSATATPTEQKSTKPPAGRADAGHTSPLAPVERQTQPRARQNQQNFGSMRASGPAQHMQNGPPRQPGTLSARLNFTQQQHRQGAPMAPMQHQPLPIHDPRAPPTGPSASSSGLQSPTGSTRWNPTALFTPNPASKAFVPTPSNPSTGSSPVREGASSRPPPERKAPARGTFFEGRKPIVPASERPSVVTAFNPIPRMKEEISKGDKPNAFEENGGIPNAFKTGPSWPVSEENKNKTYVDMFEKPQSNVPSASPHHPNVVSQPIPYHNQLPYQPHQAPQMPHGQTPHQTPRHHPVQPQPSGPSTPHHYDDHQRMQFSQSTSSVHPSPRAMQPFMYNGQGQGPPPGQFYGQMPAYGMQAGGQPMMLRQASNGPHFIPPGPGMPGQVMQQQPGGQFMPVNPGTFMYSPVPPHAYPQHGNTMPQQQQGPNGYSSPRPPAQLMSHQGSQQGHPPQVFYVQQPGAHNPAMYAQTPQGPSKSIYVNSSEVNPLTNSK